MKFHKTLKMNTGCDKNFVPICSGHEFFRNYESLILEGGRGLYLSWTPFSKIFRNIFGGKNADLSPSKLINIYTKKLIKCVQNCKISPKSLKLSTSKIFIFFYFFLLVKKFERKFRHVHRKRIELINLKSLFLNGLK